MTLRLSSAGESHGPALVAIVSGLPAGLTLDRAAIDADLKRRQEGYGRSPRQQIEQDRVEVLAGLRHGRTLGTPLALVVRNVDHKNWTWGMSPWPPEGEPAGKGTKPVTLPRPGHADLAGVLKYGHDDVRNALERASARHTAVHVAAGGVAKALLAAIGISVRSTVVDEAGLRANVDEARAERDTVGGIVEVRATGAPPGLGSYAAKEDRLDARLAFALMGIQAVKGVEIGDGFALASLRGSAAHDEIRPDRRRDTNHAGGIEAGVSNGEEIVVRAAMKPLPTLMKPLASVDLATGSRRTRSSSARTSRPSRRSPSWPRRRSPGSSAWRRTRSSAVTRSRTSSPRMPPTSRVSHGAERARPAHCPDRVHGRGQDNDRPRIAQLLDRKAVEVDEVVVEKVGDIDQVFEQKGEAFFRVQEAGTRPGA